LSASSEKRKKPSERVKKKKKSNQFILCKSAQRSYLQEKILFLFSYIRVHYIIYLKYPLWFIIFTTKKTHISYHFVWNFLGNTYKFCCEKKFARNCYQFSCKIFCI